MNRLLILCLISAMLCACSPALRASTENLTSGVKGQSLLGPTCPVVTVENPCPDRPYPASLTILRPNGQEVMRFETDADGKFEVQLPPGDYILHPENPAGRPTQFGADVPFTVLPNEFTNIIVMFDSGIR